MNLPESSGMNMNDTKEITLTNNQIIDVPRLASIVEALRPVPSSLVMFGMAQDGYPVWLDTSDKNASNTVVWDKKARQGLRILRVISEYLFRFHQDIRYDKTYGIEFVVLTTHPEDYGELNDYGMGMRGKTSCIGIIPFFSELSEKVIAGLAAWVAERHNHSKQPVIVLVDGLENVNSMSDGFKFHFRHLLDLGRSKHVYVIGTASKRNFSMVQNWLDGFQREIYGRDVEVEFEYMVGKETILFYTPMAEL
jgi:hypothetical protein